MTDRRKLRSPRRGGRGAVLALVLAAFALGACEMLATEFVRNEYWGKSFLQPGKIQQPYFRDEYGNPTPGGDRVPARGVSRDSPYGTLPAR